MPEPGDGTAYRRITRDLLAIMVVRAVALGIPTTISALFAVQILGFDLRAVGLCLTFGAAIAVAASPVVGHLSDLLGARGLYAALMLLEAVGIAVLAWSPSLAVFLVAVTAIAISDIGQRSAQGVVIVGLLPPARRVHVRAVLRVGANIGYAAGGAAGGAVLAFDEPAGYVAALLAASGGLTIVTAMILRLPAVAAAAPEHRGKPWAVFRDRSYLAFMTLNGILNIHNTMLGVAIPLWVAVATDAPAWVVSVLFVLNVVVVVLLQIRLSRGTELVAGAATAGRRAGLLLSLAAILLAVSDVSSQPVTIGLLLAAVLAHTLGEILESASAWGVSFAVAPPALTGQYQGALAMGRGVGDLIGPYLLTAVAVSWGWPGWLVIAAIFGLVGLATPYTTRRLKPAAPHRGVYRDRSG
jgi:MFS family permease